MVRLAGNDVAMIQEAHVGVGLSGKEGLQAARAADFRHWHRPLRTSLEFNPVSLFSIFCKNQYSLGVGPEKKGERSTDEWAFCA